MTENEINRKLNRAVKNTVPDVLDNVLAQCKNNTQGKVIKMTETKRNNRMFKKFAAAAAALVILVAGVAGIISYRDNNFVAAKISLDVNPSVEIDINKSEKVVKVLPLNDDGKKIVGNMDFSGSDLEVAVNAIIGSMLKEGYIDELSNSILISVDNDDQKQGNALKERLAEMINGLISGDDFSAAVLSQTVTHNSETQKLAEEYGITEGKAQLISQIIAADSRYTFEKLAPLSINELNLLASSGEEISGNIGHTGTASDKKYIGANKAKAAALAHAGVAENAITNYGCELDFDDGVMVYEVEFNAGGTEYEYDINALDGSVVKHSTDRDDDYDDRFDDDFDDGDDVIQSNGFIGADKAKAAALAHAGIAESNIRDYSIELDEENKTAVYEIEFESAGYDYSYDINALTGEIVKSEKEKD